MDKKEDKFSSLIWQSLEDWTGDNNIPDFSQIRENLEKLLTAGKADEVLAFGEHLLKKGIEQFEKRNVDGKTGIGISRCLRVVFNALGRSSLPVSRRVLWEINAVLLDNYSLLYGIQIPISGKDATKDDWNAVAEERAKRLPPLKAMGKDKMLDFSGKYDRDRIASWLTFALKNAG
jgi:uncharacterized Zn finger protein